MICSQDVSDRIEKEEITSRVLVELETGNSFVLTLPDWRDMIEQEIAEDLRKYRTYRHDSVRDLLRALRNKVTAIKRIMNIVKCVNTEQGGNWGNYDTKKKKKC